VSISRGKIFVVSAPSGCGKTTLCNRLLSDGLGLKDSISATTRPPRKNEKNGRDYFFIPRTKFESVIKKGGFLEYEENFGNLYGTPRSPVERAIKKGNPVLLSIDVKGAMKVKKAYPAESVLIFIMPPSIKELKKRLHLRSSDTKEVIRKRLAFAKKEISFSGRYDYRITNDRLTVAHNRLKKIVLKELGLKGK
jgi:guanylate kinase